MFENVEEHLDEAVRLAERCPEKYQLPCFQALIRVLAQFDSLPANSESYNGRLVSGNGDFSSPLSRRWRLSFSAVRVSIHDMTTLGRDSASPTHRPTPRSGTGEGSAGAPPAVSRTARTIQYAAPPPAASTASAKRARPAAFARSRSARPRFVLVRNIGPSDVARPPIRSATICGAYSPRLVPMSVSYRAPWARAYGRRRASSSR